MGQYHENGHDHTLICQRCDLEQSKERNNVRNNVAHVTFPIIKVIDISLLVISSPIILRMII